MQRKTTCKKSSLMSWPDVKLIPQTNKLCGNPDNVYSPRLPHTRLTCLLSRRSGPFRTADRGRDDVDADEDGDCGFWAGILGRETPFPVRVSLQREIHIYNIYYLCSVNRSGVFQRENVWCKKIANLTDSCFFNTKTCLQH